MAGSRGYSAVVGSVTVPAVVMAVPGTDRHSASGRTPTLGWIPDREGGRQALNQRTQVNLRSRHERSLTQGGGITRARSFATGRFGSQRDAHGWPDEVVAGSRLLAGEQVAVRRASAFRASALRESRVRREEIGPRSFAGAKLVAIRQA